MLPNRKNLPICVHRDDEKARIIPPIVMSLEESLEYIKEDEYLEVTPHHLRIRKIILDEIERKRANR